MQKTLFLYIFKDLLKVFLLASGALAGIMSFGGLLRPLTQHGLDLGQVGQMLAYFMPAMTNYSWPIAALFATTFVYGRLSADNELTACRAAGMSYLNILVPAGVLGTIVTILSAFFLSYVVPHSFLRAEQVVYTNLAKLVAGQIDRTQRVNLNTSAQSVTIFARTAEVLEPNEINPRDQAVELTNVAIVKYLNEKKDGPKIPEEFFLADSAVAIIQMPDTPDGDVRLTINFTNGSKIPRPSDGRGRPLIEASIQSAPIGPIPLQSPVRETAKFMDLQRLTDLRVHPEKSRRILQHLNELARIDQSRVFIEQVRRRAAAGQVLTFVNPDPDRGGTYSLTLPHDTAINVVEDKLILTAGTLESPGIAFEFQSDKEPFTGKSREAVISVNPDMQAKSVFVRLETRDALLLYQNQESSLQSKEWNIATAMPDDIARLATRSVWQYLEDDALTSRDRVKKLRTDVYRQQNQIEGELHSRFGFALSCLVLALVGATIGMLFRSGNFVSAFAVSVGPALLCIVLIVTGQHICEAIPHEVGNTLSDPTKLGLPVLWAGNVLVVTLGLALYHRLSRT